MSRRISGLGDESKDLLRSLRLIAKFFAVQQQTSSPARTSLPPLVLISCFRNLFVTLNTINRSSKRPHRARAPAFLRVIERWRMHLYRRECQHDVAESLRRRLRRRGGLRALKEPGLIFAFVPASRELF